MSHLNAWLLDKALPLWSTVGLDKVRGGFHEMISQSGEAVAANRRARVAGRQVYVYATAARSGLPGPWRAAAEHGLDFIVTRFLQPDGMMRCLLSPQGEPLEADLMLYDQAFCLFALAAAAGCGLDPDAQLERALRLRRGLETNWRIPDGGFIENDVHRYQANPHMHLLEASLAWEETAPGQGWEALADELAQFALETFIDPKGGFLREFFSPDWTPAPGADGRWIEPGHLFEWAWLMARWARARGREDVLQAARRLHQVGLTQGLDAERGVAIDAIFDDFSIARDQARLWPQTERIKAAAIMAELADSEGERAEFQREAEAAARGLSLYFQTEVPGLYWDKLNRDGSFVPENAPASSLYHIACAILDARSRGLVL